MNKLENAINNVRFLEQKIGVGFILNSLFQKIISY